MRAHADLRDESEAGNARVRPFERLLARCSRMFLLPGYSVVPMGTNANATDLAKSLRAWFDGTRERKE